jgi:epoxyqueuosine reductase
VAREAKLQARDDLRAPDLDDLAGLDDGAFRAFFSGSPIKRIGVARFRRNLMVAIGNAGDMRLRPRVLENLAHEDPQVRAMAVWAAARLFDASELAALAEIHANESDADVAREWTQALAPQEHA